MDRPSLPSSLDNASSNQPLATKAAKGSLKLPVPLRDILPARKKRRWWSWVGVVVMGIVAAGSGVLSANLHDHASERRQLMDETTQLEVEATELSSTVWRALTMLMAQDKMKFIRLRGETGEQRSDILARVDRLIELDGAGDAYNRMLGFETQPEFLEALDHTTGSFLGSIQGTLSQMKMSTERTRKRLRYWDMNFGPFIESLRALKDRNAEIAEASAMVAKRVATGAGLARLLASVLLVWTVSRQRTGRHRRATDLLPPGQRRVTDLRLDREPTRSGEVAQGAPAEDTVEPESLVGTNDSSPSDFQRA